MQLMKFKIDCQVKFTPEYGDDSFSGLNFYIMTAHLYFR